MGDTVTILFGADHAGYALKSALVDHFRCVDRYRVVDCGTDSVGSVDYPDYATPVVKGVLEGKQAFFGVLICGTGIGMSIVSNRHPGIRAALCYNTAVAEMARRHNCANVLCLGARMCSLQEAFDICNVFLTTVFIGGRHQVRINKIDERL